LSSSGLRTRDGDTFAELGEPHVDARIRSRFDIDAHAFVRPKLGRCSGDLSTIGMQHERSEQRRRNVLAIDRDGTAAAAAHHHSSGPGARHGTVTSYGARRDPRTRGAIVAPPFESLSPVTRPPRAQASP